LGRIQNELFDLGADLATPERDEPLGFEPLRVTDDQVARLEAEIDFMNETMAPLNSFVLPGGSALAAALHLARTVSRRAERTAVALTHRPGEKVSPVAIAYLNRLSDHLFVASRRANSNGGADVLWVPGATRGQDAG
jgi:cob(I)alamin adenosyltransferase